MANLKSGYVRRSAHRMPKQLDRAPWLNRDEYLVDYFQLRYRRLDDGILQFQRGSEGIHASTRPNGTRRAAQPN